MKKIVLLIGLLIAKGSNALTWGPINLASEKIRTYKESFSHNLDQKKAYVKTLILFKTFGDSNSLIKTKNLELGLIVAKSSVECNVLKIGNGQAKEERVEFDIEITFEKNKASVKFGDVVGTADKENSFFDDGKRPSNKEDMSKIVDGCLRPLVSLIKDELK